MPLSLGQQWILQYKVLSGITLLEEMSLLLLNKRLHVGITLTKYHSQDRKSLGYFDMKYLGTGLHESYHLSLRDAPTILRNLSLITVTALKEELTTEM